MDIQMWKVPTIKAHTYLPLTHIQAQDSVNTGLRYNKKNTKKNYKGEKKSD